MQSFAKPLLGLLIVFGFLVSAVALVEAQTITATLTGTVTDQSGAIVPGAKIKATNQSTKLEYTGVSNEVGRYNLTFLPIGIYIINAEATGFKALVTNPVTLEVNQIARVDLKLEVGQISELITVDDVAPILQTDSTTVGEVISGSTTVNLPLNGRNFQQLTLLIPGAVTPNPSGFTGANPTSQSRPFVNGNREQGNSFLLDGISTDETIDNRIGYRPNVDAIAEFKIETNNSSAEFGNVTGAIVNTTMKSGSNSLHGNLFEFFRNDALDANTWANNRNSTPQRKIPKQKLRQNIYGGTIGGPIIQNRLFFFAAYQDTRQRTGGGTSVTVAPPEWRNGDLSGISTIIKDPLTGTAFPNNLIPQNRIVNPAALKLFSDTNLYPLPTRAGASASTISGNYATDTLNSLYAIQIDGKVDFRWTEKDNVSVRYSFGQSDSRGTKGTLPTNLTGLSSSKPQNVVINWNRTIGTTMVNEARVGMNRAVFIGNAADWAGIGEANAAFGIPGGQAMPGLSTINMGNGLTAVGSTVTAEDNVTNTFHYGDNLMITRGRHTFKMGGQWLRYQQNRYYPGNNGVLGFFTYDGTFSGSAFADFLMDQLKQKGIGSRTGTWGHRQNRIGVFFQDDFKLASNFTLNLGLRWEYTSPVVEVLDRQSNFDIATGKQLFAGKDGNSRALYDPFYKGFEPRIGFAWAPNLFSNRFVIRAGYGIVQYMEGTGSNLRLPMNPPLFSEADVPFDKSSGPGTITKGFTDVINRNTISGQMRVWNPDLRPQFTQQWNLALEYQLNSTTSITGAYVGHRASHLVAPRDWNQPLPGTGAASTWLPLQQRRPWYSVWPLVTQISGTDSSANSFYHSLQASMRKRFSKGLEFLLSYTNSKTITDNLGYYGSAGVAAASAYWSNAYDRVGDRGLAFFDATHNFVWSGTYDLPIGKGKAWGSNMNSFTNAILGGWNVSSIVSLRSGFPLTIRATDVSLQGPRGGGRPNRIASGDVANPTLTQWLDITAFVMPASGTFGNVGPSTNRAPSYANWDFGMGKKFHLSEQKYFEFRSEFFNFTNHPSFSAPGVNISDPNNFGRITSTVSPPRIVEFALKFFF